MAASIQKIAVIGLGCGMLMMQATAYSTELQACASAPLVLGSKSIGQARYFAEDCRQPWQQQSIRMEFSYTQNIPDWAFKRAATHFLQRNLQGFSTQSELNRITQWYKPVRSGDVYHLSYQHAQKSLTLSLNRKMLGSIQSAQANQYFLIWFGSKPFNAKLKQQLFNL